MSRHRKRESDQSGEFVWDTGSAGQTELPSEQSSPVITAARKPWPAWRGRALIAAAAIVPLAGGAAGLAAYLGGRSSPGSGHGALAAGQSPTVTAHATTATTSSALVGEWPLNQSAADFLGAHNATAHDVAWKDGAAVFSGASDSFVATAGAVLNTGSGNSFTVSASVSLARFPTVPHYTDTVVSQDAGTDSGFYLQYFLPGNCWAFSRVATDTVNPAKADRALSTGTVRLNTWTHLVGVYDASTARLSLYVDGKLEGTAVDTTPFASNGALAIGRGLYNGVDADGFDGMIKKVQVYEVALNASQVAALS